VFLKSFKFFWRFENIFKSSSRRQLSLGHAGIRPYQARFYQWDVEAVRSERFQPIRSRAARKCARPE
jgi:hypothetical protein